VDFGGLEVHTLIHLLVAIQEPPHTTDGGISKGELDVIKRGSCPPPRSIPPRGQIPPRWMRVVMTVTSAPSPTRITFHVFRGCKQPHGRYLFRTLVVYQEVLFLRCCIGGSANGYEVAVLSSCMTITLTQATPAACYSGISSTYMGVVVVVARHACQHCALEQI
jgi:hypothetical protein